MSAQLVLFVYLHEDINKKLTPDSSSAVLASVSGLKVTEKKLTDGEENLICYFFVVPYRCLSNVKGISIILIEISRCLQVNLSCLPVSYWLDCLLSNIVARTK